VAEKFRTVLDATAFHPPTLDYLPNVAGAPQPQATVKMIREQLAAHVCKPVRWQASIDNLASRLPDAHFIEVGPRAILYNLFGKGWMPGKRSRTDAQENWPEHMQALIGELGNGA
jgi:malonyl CoA-acyl carrier protein transacylase